MKKLLILGKVWPEPSSSAAGLRTMQLIDCFRKNNFHITFASAAAPGEFTFDLSGLGIKGIQIEINSESFDVLLKELQPEIVLFDRFTTEEQFGWRVRDHCPNALRLLDTQDLHCLRAARQKAHKEKREYVRTDLNSELGWREIASIYRCDMSLIISQFEMELLNDDLRIPLDQLYYFPLLTDPINRESKKHWPGFSEREHFISIGNFLHEPNWDSVLFLKQVIWPLIRKELPKVELHIYGAYPTKKVFELHDPETGFLIKGRADSANEVLRQARVCLAPLRFGAGLKGKLMDAMSCGTPNITTTIGAEGMQDQLPWAGDIADAPEDFAKAAVRLYTHPQNWEKAHENGVEIINTLFSKPQHEKDLIEVLGLIYESLERHRSYNFNGAMLHHHSAQSTKYMSLWIEAKNKNSSKQ